MTRDPLADFDFNLPQKLIAQKPASPRDHARLLVYDRQTKIISDDHFYNLNDHLPKNTTLTINNSKVEHCRILAENNVEIFLLSTVNPHTAEAMVRPGKKFKQGAAIKLADWLTATVDAVTPEGHRIITFSRPLNDPRFKQLMHVPLPPYIKQDDSLADEYQTVYARELGSKAAPTAGLHFTEELMKKLKKKHTVTELTLHVGLGTFAPLEQKQLESNSLHAERIEITHLAAKQLNAAKHITAVGTTSLRALESVVMPPRRFAPGTMLTDIFIRPGYQFRATDSLITNFHLPRSSLLMLIGAFMGVDEMQRVYTHAIKEGYRFYSFGDAMLIR